MSTELQEIIYKFCIQGSFVSIQPYGEGHINDTYLFTTSSHNQEYKYILQRISKKMTPNIPLLMKNVQLVSEFVQKKVLLRKGDYKREALTLVYTKESKAFYHESETDNYYRVYNFIDNATSYQRVESEQIFYESARAFGGFANSLSDFDASLLSETIQDFHNTPVRYARFLQAVDEDRHKRAAAVQDEIAWVVSKAGYIDKITSLLQSGAMPYRVTHNDTKLNNVMIDNISLKAIAVIDLDTVMKGSICYDFGDSIRFGCNTASEHEKDLSKVKFDLNLFSVYAKGFLSAFTHITPIEKQNLAMGALIMTYECGMRFLTDYLCGDEYFKTHYIGQNLDRARVQFKLVDEMEGNYDKMQNIINGI